MAEKNRILAAVIAVLICMVMIAFNEVEVYASDYSINPQGYDFGGRTINISGFRGRNPLVYETGDLEEGEGLEWRLKVEEAFNVKVTFNGVGRSDFITSVMAGDPITDVYRDTRSGVWEIVDAGIYYPLNDVLDEDYYASIPPQHRGSIQSMMTYGGEIIGFSMLYEGPPFTLIWNKDLFEREGLPSLYDLIDSKEWTWDTFKEIAAGAARDTTGDGQIDQFGAPLLEDEIWMPSSNARVTRIVDGRYMFALNEPEALDFLEFMSEVNRMGPEGGIAEVGRGGARELFVDQRLAIDQGTVVDIGRHYTELEDDYGLAYVPLGPGVEEYRTAVVNPRTLVIPITADQPRAKIELVHTLFKMAKPFLDFEEYTEREIDYVGQHLRDYESLEIYSNMVRSDKYFDNVPGLFPINRGPTAELYSKLLHQIMTGEITPAVGMEELAPEAQAVIDSIFN